MLRQAPGAFGPVSAVVGTVMDLLGVAERDTKHTIQPLGGTDWQRREP